MMFFFLLPIQSEPVAETEDKGLVCDVVASPGLQDSGQEGDGDDEREESVQPEPARRTSLVDTDTAHIVSQIEDCALLQIHRLQEWDYPIFELADLAGDYILSKVGFVGNKEESQGRAPSVYSQFR